MLKGPGPHAQVELFFVSTLSHPVPLSAVVPGFLTTSRPLGLNVLETVWSASALEKLPQPCCSCPFSQSAHCLISCPRLVAAYELAQWRAAPHAQGEKALLRWQGLSWTEQ